MIAIYSPIFTERSFWLRHPTLGKRLGVAIFRLFGRHSGYSSSCLGRRRLGETTTSKISPHLVSPIYSLQGGVKIYPLIKTLIPRTLHWHLCNIILFRGEEQSPFLPTRRGLTAEVGWRNTLGKGCGKKRQWKQSFFLTHHSKFLSVTPARGSCATAEAL